MRNVFSQSQKVCVNNYDTTGLFTQKHLDLKEFKKKEILNCLFWLTERRKGWTGKQSEGRLDKVNIMLAKSKHTAGIKWSNGKFTSKIKLKHNEIISISNIILKITLVAFSRSTSINCCKPYNGRQTEYRYQRNCNTTYFDRTNGHWFVRWIDQLDIDTWKKWTVIKSHKCQSRLRNSNILLHLKFKKTPSYYYNFLHEYS